MLHIPERAQQGIAALEQQAKDSLIANGQSLNYARTSQLYKEAAVRWIQCIEHFMPECVENAAARQAEYKKVLPLYDAARGYLFKSINESTRSNTSLDMVQEFLEIEVNTMALALACNAISNERINSAKINIQQAKAWLLSRTRLPRSIIGFVFLSFANYMATLENIDRNLVCMTYESAISSLSDYIEENFELIRIDLHHFYSVSNIPMVKKYIAELNTIWGLTASLTCALNTWGDPNTVTFSMGTHQLNCKRLEALISPGMQAAAELEMDLFTRGYDMPGIESINRQPPKSTLRNRLR